MRRTQRTISSSKALATWGYWAVIAAVVAAPTMLARCATPPSDERVARQFSSHRAEFEQLLAMFSQESATLMAVRPEKVHSSRATGPGEFGWTDKPEARHIMTSTKFRLYAKLMKDAGVESIWRDEPETVKFTIWSDPTAWLGSTQKLVIYSPVRRSLKADTQLLAPDWYSEGYSHGK